MRILRGIFALIPLLCGCPANSTTGRCGNDLECKGARICVEGACVDPPVSASSSSSSSSSSSPPGVATSTMSPSSATAFESSSAVLGASSTVLLSSSSSSSSSSRGTGGCVPVSTALSDRMVHSEPALPSLPAAGGTFTDPVFGTTIMRATDENDCAQCTTNYSYWPTFNADDTRILFSSGGGAASIVDFDPVNFRRDGAARPLFAGPVPGGGYPVHEDAVWSALDPDVVFAHAGATLVAYDVTTRAYTVLRDFSPEMPGQYLWQMSRDVDDNVFAWARRDATTYAYTGFLAWRRDTDTILVNTSTTELDEVQVDKTGAWLVIKTGLQGHGAIEVRIADLSTGTIVADLTDDAPDFAPGHSDNGRGTVIGADNWTNRITLRALETPHSPSTLLDFGSDWTQAFHLSALGDDENWLTLSQYGAPGGLFHQEILLFSSDGTQEVRRLAHHRSVFNGYDDTPRANISRDGCFIAFTSNWGGRDRRDVFILRAGERP